MAMATRLLRSFRFGGFRPLLPPPPPPASSNLAAAAGLLRRSPPADVRHLHVLPRGGVLPGIRWWFGGRSSACKAAAASTPRRSILNNMLSASFISTSAAAAALLDSDNDMKSPPTRPHSVSDSGSGAGAATTPLLYWRDGTEKKPPTRPYVNVEREKRRVTDVLIALNLLVHAVDRVANRKLIMWGSKSTGLIRKGQIWRLATPCFLHRGIIHITCNMFFLDDIGPVMEEITGPRRFLATYCTSALAGNLMSYRFTRGNSVGASGALCGLVGAQGVYKWRRRESMASSSDIFKEIGDIVLSTMVLTLALRLIKIRIDNWAHLGGFLGGAAAEWFLGPREKEHVARVGTMVYEEREHALINYQTMEDRNNKLRT